MTKLEFLSKEYLRLSREYQRTGNAITRDRVMKVLKEYERLKKQQKESKMAKKKAKKGTYRKQGRVKVRAHTRKMPKVW